MVELSARLIYGPDDNATTAVAPAMMTANGPQRYRSHRVSEAMFAIPLRAMRAAITQVAADNQAAGSGALVTAPAFAKTTHPEKTSTSAEAALAQRRRAGNLSGCLPPQDAAPKGAPAANTSWNPATAKRPMAASKMERCYSVDPVT